MDEEFIGGTTLQGACSNFRGKLCVWAHLLKVTPENSRALVNKLVPKQSGQSGYDKIIASVESDAAAGASTAAAPPSAVPSNAKVATPQNIPTSPKRAAQAARSEGIQKNNRSSSRPGSRGRAGSAARGKQGAWKEALGPTEKGIGWKGNGKRGPSTGLARWKKLVESKPTQSGKQTAAAKGAGQKANQLKAMLGVSASPAPAPPSNQPSAAMSTAADLKALLGVGGASANTGIPLSQIPNPPMPPPQMMAQGPPPPSQPASAAEKLFALMQSKQPQGQPGPMYPGPPQPSSFNFTYVEEGKEGAPQPHMQHMMPPPHHPMQMQMQYPPPPNAYSYGYPPPPPAHMMPPPPMHMHSPPPPPLPAGPSVEEFPPLGANAAPAKASAPKAEESKSAGPTGASAIVPTVIKSKSRK